MKKEILVQIEEIVGSERVKVDEPMNLHTTFRIGGKADYYVQIKTVGEIKRILDFCAKEELPYYVIGNGSNLLVGDKGYRGLILEIGSKMGDVIIEGTKITVQAGALLSKIGNLALEAGLTGVEFATGIPGTLGGAVVMNAGAYGGEIKHVLSGATVLTKEGIIKNLSKEELELGYRTSCILGKECIVLEGMINLEVGDKEQIQKRMQELKMQRIEKQPLEYPSAGSTFKRPEGYFAGKLVMDAGLRGYQLGGAQVAQKHCGFLINRKDATASDVVSLINHIKNEVKAQFKVELETEIKMIGEF